MDENELEIVELDGEPFEVIGRLRHESETYVALDPRKFIVMKEVEKNGESFLATIDDDELHNKIGDMFLELFESDSDL